MLYFKSMEEISCITMILDYGIYVLEIRNTRRRVTLRFHRSREETDTASFHTLNNLSSSSLP